MTDAGDIRRTTQQPVIDRLLASREALLASAEPSPAAALDLARLADAAVRALAESAEPPGPWAVIALGGYGAGRLLPGSDLDLLIVSDAPPHRVKPFAEAVFYPLWDSGLPVGHQVRSRKEQLRACAVDVATLTATLTGRVVAGDDALGAGVLAEVASRAQRDRKRLTRELAARPRPGSPYLLEPDLKEGMGGRRDLDEIAWTAAILAGTPVADGAALVTLGLLSAEEHAALEDAAGTLTAARWTLHLGQRRHREVLSLEAAEDLPFPPDELARALAAVAHTLTRLRRRLAGEPQPPLPATPAALFDALDAGERALPLLEEAVWAGSLDTLVPGLAPLMDLRRPGLSHTLTVGAHCLAAAALVATAPSLDPFAAEVLRGLPDRRPLLVAALTHDFGKREPGPGHAARGQGAARRAAEALGLDARGTEDAALLVREHLLLAETASRSDVADEDAVLRAAAHLGVRELVGPLYVLTLADTEATTRGSWTPWRRALTRELAARMDAALSPDVEGAGIARTAEERREAALGLLGSDERRRAFVEQAPLRYLASTPPAVMAMHAELAAPLVGTSDRSAAAVAVTTGPLPATWRVTVATLDRHGLFATLAGVFSLAGLSILDADAMGGPGGTAIDVFTVASATLAAVDTATWAGFERTLRAALGGRLELEVRLAERRRHYSARRGDVAPTVASDTGGGYATSFSVRAADRAGLLHDLARTLADAQLDITSATVLTHDGVAQDTFRVVDASGAAPSDPALLAQVAHRLQVAADGQD